VNRLLEDDKITQLGREPFLSFWWSEKTGNIREFFPVYEKSVKC